MTPRKKKKAAVALAAVTPIPSDQMFVRVPLPPEVVAIVRKHVDAAGGLFAMGRGVLELVMGTSDAARAFLDGCQAAVADARTDVQRARGAASKKKRARRR